MRFGTRGLTSVCLSGLRQTVRRPPQTCGPHAQSPHQQRASGRGPGGDAGGHLTAAWPARPSGRRGAGRGRPLRSPGRLPGPRGAARRLPKEPGGGGCKRPEEPRAPVRLRTPRGWDRVGLCSRLRLHPGRTAARGTGGTGGGAQGHPLFILCPPLLCSPHTKGRPGARPPGAVRRGPRPRCCVGVAGAGSRSSARARSACRQMAPGSRGCPSHGARLVPPPAPALPGNPSPEVYSQDVLPLLHPPLHIGLQP